MKNLLKVVGAGLIGILCLMLLLFGTGVLDLGMRSFFKPRVANIERRVFENTQSYSQGKTAEISKYYLEYQTADAEGKRAITNVIKLTFADFDAGKINNPALYSFLITTRGY